MLLAGGGGPPWLSARGNARGLQAGVPHAAPQPVPGAVSRPEPWPWQGVAAARAVRDRWAGRGGRRGRRSVPAWARARRQAGRRWAATPARGPFRPGSPAPWVGQAGGPEAVGAEGPGLLAWSPS